jgi:GxxExxY protein
MTSTLYDLKTETTERAGELAARSAIPFGAVRRPRSACSKENWTLRSRLNRYRQRTNSRSPNPCTNSDPVPHRSTGGPISLTVPARHRNRSSVQPKRGCADIITDALPRARVPPTAPFRRGRNTGRREDGKFWGWLQRSLAPAFEVQRHLGPGLLESAYKACLCREFSLRGLSFEDERTVPLEYKGVLLDCGYRIDFIVDRNIIVEIKAVEKLLPVHQAQVITYLKRDDSGGGAAGGVVGSPSSTPRSWSTSTSP